jgi:hypothetical protein
MSNEGYISKNELANTVSVYNQVDSKENAARSGKEGGLKVLFVGNSITLHGPNSEIGWSGNWGMAASSMDKDYVHLTAAMLEEKYGKVETCILNCAAWERGYADTEEVLDKHYSQGRDFGADLVIIRLGENMPHDASFACKPHFEEMIRYFAVKDGVKVVLTDSFWRNDARDAMIKQIAKENGYAFCQLHDLEEDECTMAIGLFEHEGVARHPGDIGMQRIAERIVEAIG